MSPFRPKEKPIARVFKLEDDVDEYGSSFKGKVKSGCGDEYEEDDFDE